MAEYIEREAAINEFANRSKFYDAKWGNKRFTPDDVETIIRSVPAADVVPVVRCGECKHRHDDNFCGGRGWPAHLVPDDGYCDRGVRKDGGGE